MKEIEKLANELYANVLEIWLSERDMSFSYYLEKELDKYNEEVHIIIESLIYAKLTKELIKTIEPHLLTKVKLSNTLYKNASNVRKSVLREVNEHIKRGSTIDTIQKALFEGYEFKDDEILKVKQKLPKYLFGEISNSKLEAMKLKTKPLKAAYIQLLNSKSEKAFQKNMKVALYEKSRYYANRIAVTEEHRAFSFSNAKEIFEDEEVEFVKYTLSSRHPKKDICDYYANLDVGYGRGVVKKGDMIGTPLHPYCKCKYEQIYRKVKTKSIKNPEQTTMKQFSKRDQIKILGSQNAKDRFDSGEGVEGIFNSSRKKYPIVKIGELF